MAIRFLCQHCQKRLKVDERHAGRQVKCPRCGEPLVVPSTSGTHEIAPIPKEIRQEEDEQLELPPRRGSFASDDEMDMTPMVDMVFLLLIFFMVTAAFSLQKSIEMPTPDQTEGVAQSRTMEEIEEDDDFIIVRIERDNTIWIEDSVAYTDVELLARLRSIRETGTRPPSSLLVMASGDAMHETVVMALDCGTAVGMENIRLAELGEDDY